MVTVTHTCCALLSCSASFARMLTEQVLDKANSERETTGAISDYYGTRHQHCPLISTVAISTS